MRRTWVLGLIGAAINGAATAITAFVVDPAGFSDWSKLLRIISVSAVVGAALYIKQHPPLTDEECERD